MFTNYLRLVVFAVGLLVGIQVPGFVDQYSKRVSAHQLEVAQNFRGFQQTADRYFNGSVEALVAHHLSSTDAAFRDEAKTIQSLADRLKMLSAELAALRGPLIAQIVHVMLRANREILAETWAAYTYTVPLNAAAIVSGVASGTVIALLTEGVLLGLWRLIRPRRHASNIGHAPRNLLG